MVELLSVKSSMFELLTSELNCSVGSSFTFGGLPRFPFKLCTLGLCTLGLGTLELRTLRLDTLGLCNTM